MATYFKDPGSGVYFTIVNGSPSIVTDAATLKSLSTGALPATSQSYTASISSSTPATTQTTTPAATTTTASTPTNTIPTTGAITSWTVSPWSMNTSGNFVTNPTVTVNGQSYTFSTPQEYVTALQTIQNRGGTGTIAQNINEFQSAVAYSNSVKPATPAVTTPAVTTPAATPATTTPAAAATTTPNGYYKDPGSGAYFQVTNGTPSIITDSATLSKLAAGTIASTSKSYTSSISSSTPAATTTPVTTPAVTTPATTTPVATPAATTPVTLPATATGTVTTAATTTPTVPTPTATYYKDPGSGVYFTITNGSPSVVTDSTILSKLSSGALPATAQSYTSSIASSTPAATPATTAPTTPAVTLPATSTGAVTSTPVAATTSTPTTTASTSSATYYKDPGSGVYFQITNGSPSVVTDSTILSKLSSGALPATSQSYTASIGSSTPAVVATPAATTPAATTSQTTTTSSAPTATTPAAVAAPVITNGYYIDPTSGAYFQIQNGKVMTISDWTTLNNMNTGVYKVVPLSYAAATAAQANNTIVNSAATTPAAATPAATTPVVTTPTVTLPATSTGTVTSTPTTGTTGSATDPAIIAANQAFVNGSNPVGTTPTSTTAPAGGTTTPGTNGITTTANPGATATDPALVAFNQAAVAGNTTAMNNSGPVTNAQITNPTTNPTTSTAITVPSTGDASMDAVQQAIVDLGNKLLTSGYTIPANLQITPALVGQFLAYAHQAIDPYSQQLLSSRIKDVNANLSSLSTQYTNSVGQTQQQFGTDLANEQNAAGAAGTAFSGQRNINELNLQRTANANLSNLAATTGYNIGSAARSAASDVGSQNSGGIVLPGLSTGAVSISGGQRGSSSSTSPLAYNYDPSLYTVGTIPSQQTGAVNAQQQNYLSQYGTLAGNNSNSNRSVSDLLGMMSGLPSGYQVPSNLT